jgi:ubiquinone/menaquinone biosynthesis C-methylase UbiE
LNSAEAGAYWEANASVWTQLTRAGYDLNRDLLNTPAFLSILPPVGGKHGLDVGCGEGHNTRLIARLGAAMIGLDVSPTFIENARSFVQPGLSPIQYVVGDGERLPFPNAHFDFITAFMSLMDMPNIGAALGEAHRVLKPSGFLQFSITHPCSDLSHHKNLRDPSGVVYAIELGGYFRGPAERIQEWTFGAAAAELRTELRRFRVPTFRRTLSDWLNSLARVGFILEETCEPCPDDQAVQKEPYLQDCQVMPQFLIIRARKAADSR